MYPTGKYAIIIENGVHEELRDGARAPQYIAKTEHMRSITTKVTRFLQEATFVVFLWGECMTFPAAAIHGKKIGFAYEFDGRLHTVLKDVDVDVRAGEWIAILGRNGCGKSTLVKHFNALLPLQCGTLKVAGIDARDARETWRLRRLCGMVFQNPDNQFVSSLLEEDIAFGLENYETPRAQIAGKVRDALQRVGLEGYEKRSPHSLSGGQKQRAALAGVLALEPDIVVFDEVTAMLDPEGRREILEGIRRLRDDMGKTAIMITHYVEEAVLADRVFLLQDGRMLAEGTPRDILTNVELLREAALTPPLPVRVYNDLKRAGISLSQCPLTEEELVEALCPSH